MTHLEQDVVNSDSLLKWAKFLFTDKSVVSYQSHTILTPLQQKRT